jgi:hypothetical protein
VFDDNASILTGGSDRDWFFANLDGEKDTKKEEVTKVKKNDFASEIDMPNIASSSVGAFLWHLGESIRERSDGSIRLLEVC